MQPLLPWKAVSVTYYECVFLDFGIKHVMRMRHVTLSSVACPACTRYLINSAFFEKKKKTLLDIKCVF